MFIRNRVMEGRIETYITPELFTGTIRINDHSFLPQLID